MLLTVGDKPVFQCELCPTTCGRKTDLRIHVQKLHTSDKPLKCKRCGKTFPDRFVFDLSSKSIFCIQYKYFEISKLTLFKYFSMSLGTVTNYTARHTRVRNVTNAIFVHTRQYRHDILKATCSSTQIKSRISAITVINRLGKSNS